MSQILTTHIKTSPRIVIDYAGNGPLVVFLHGIGGNRSNWREQLEALSDSYLCVAVDLRGYGQSDDYEGPLAFSDFNDDVARVIQHFDRDAAHLVGLSMGGLIAQNFYRLHSSKVLSLTLADTRNKFVRHNNEEFLRRREAPLLAGQTPADIAPSLAPTLASPQAALSIVKRLEQSIAALHKESYLKTLRATTLVPESNEFRGLSNFVDPATVNVPTLVICGTEDTVTPPALSQELAADISGATLALIEGAGHLSNIENPDVFNNALRQFLQSQKSHS